MPFTIQSCDLAAVPARQSVWYDTDLAILAAGIAGTGVLTGCAVTAQGTPDMTLAVAAGTIQPTAGAAAVTVTSGNVTIGTAHATLPRIDLVTASATGTKTVTDGTAATEPKPPALPSGHIALAMVDVPATDTTIETAQITDKRAMVFAAGSVADILDLPTVEDDDTLVLAPDGAGGVEFRAEAGGGGDPRPYFDSGNTLHATYGDDFAAAALDGKWTPTGNFKADAANFAVSGTWMRFAGFIGTMTIFEAGPTTDTFEVIAAQSVWANSDEMIGPAVVSSSGTGIMAIMRLTGLYVNNVSSYAYTTDGVYATIGAVAVSRGLKHWFSIRRVKTALAGGIYFVRASFDGMTWSASAVYIPSSFTPAKIGFGRLYDPGTQTDLRIGIDRINVVDDLNQGADLVRTPTSGTPTYTASSSYGGLPASNAADGTASDWAASSGATDAPLYWQVAWSVGQTLNRVVFKERGGNRFGIGHLELYNGSTTTKVPIETTITDTGTRWHLVDFATLTGITSLRIVSDFGGQNTGGLIEVEAYYRS